MDESFDLLSSMSPKIRGRQQTVKINHVSRLALKKHFRRSLALDKSNLIRNQDLAVIEVSTESSESVESFKEPKNKNDIVIIDSSDSDDDLSKKLPNEPKNVRVQQWLDDVTDQKKSESFFSLVSTIAADDPAKIDHNIAACSSFNEDNLNHRFDELFIDNKKSNSKLDESSFSLGLGLINSLESKLEKETISDKVIDETILTDDSIKTPSKNDIFVSIRKKCNKENKEVLKTPNLSIKEASSILDSIYGKKWRVNEDSVLLSLSEPKKQPNKRKEENKVEVPKTERVLKPVFKGNLMPAKKLNFDKLKKPIQSPWMQQLKGLVDTDSDNENDNQIQKKPDIKSVRLDFDDSPLILKKNLDSNKNKENVPKSGKKIKKNAYKQSGSSNSSNEDEEVATDEEYDKEIEILEIKRQSMMPQKQKAFSFLESLSATVPLNKCDLSARIFRSNYKQHREELAKKLFKIFNEKIFNNAIPLDTELEWNSKLRKTAGLCHCKKITHRQKNIERKVRISLSSKVLDSADRLRDTLVHEMCHAVTWIVNEVSDGHGSYWKSWAFKAMNTFPELPPIKRCHNYMINSKYTYRCTKCGYSFGRHSKSLDIERKRCGHCYGKFEILINKTTKNGETKTLPVGEKKTSGFALFVKENYALYKDPTKKHGDIMKILGQKFAELKVKN